MQGKLQLWCLISDPAALLRLKSDSARTSEAQQRLEPSEGPFLASSQRQNVSISVALRGPPKSAIVSPQPALRTSGSGASAVAMASPGPEQGPAVGLEALKGV